MKMHLAVQKMCQSIMNMVVVGIPVNMAPMRIRLKFYSLWLFSFSISTSLLSVFESVFC